MEPLRAACSIIILQYGHLQLFTDADAAGSRPANRQMSVAHSFRGYQFASRMRCVLFYNVCCEVDGKT